MFAISILLFWIPVLGGFLAGFVGGRKAGNVERALIAVFLPAIIFGAFIFFFSGVLLGMPIIGALLGFGAVLGAVLHVGPMLLGAVIGGATA
jgi:hypothetical protein